MDWRTNNHRVQLFLDVLANKILHQVVIKSVKGDITLLLILISNQDITEIVVEELIVANYHTLAWMIMSRDPGFL